ncbi:hypothetical protein ABZ649_04615 [Streptomyces albidoflavus]|uniref:hypothetical protein n=1 Tax=Streptomyces albidoflavus TaxID=1886 RepID=UPI0033C36D24
MDVTKAVAAYSIQQVGGEPPQAVLHLSGVVAPVLDGLARVVVGVPPDPGPAAAEFLSAIDPGELERAALGRHDLLDGQPHELVRAMLVQLVEWARGGWSGSWEPADVAIQPPPERTP